MNGWCLTPALAVFQLYRGAVAFDMNEFITKIFHIQPWTTMRFIVQTFVHDLISLVYTDQQFGQEQEKWTKRQGRIYDFVGCWATYTVRLHWWLTRVHISDSWNQFIQLLQHNVYIRPDMDVWKRNTTKRKK